MFHVGQHPLDEEFIPIDMRSQEIHSVGQAPLMQATTIWAILIIGAGVWLWTSTAK